MTKLKNRRQAVTAVKDMQQLPLEVLTTQSSQAMITLDDEGKVVGWNPGAEAMLGYSADEMQGRAYRELVPDKLRGAFDSALGKVRRGRKLAPHLTQRLRKDHSLAQLSIELHGLLKEDQSLAGFLILHADVAAQFEAEESLTRQTAHMQAIVQTVVDGIITIDARGSINAVNPAVESMFGYRGHELIGQNVKLLMPDPYHSDHDQYLRNYQKTGRAKIIGIGREVPALRKDGSEFPIELAVAKMHIGDEVGYVGILRDITERRAAQKKLQSLNTTLNLKVDELSRTLQELRETQSRLVEAEKLASLGGLVGGVAHEINTPLGVCVTASSYVGEVSVELQKSIDAGALRKSDLDAFVSRLQDSSKILDENLSRTAELVNSFKQIAVQQTDNERRAFNLKSLLLSLLPSLRTECLGHSVELTLQCPADVDMVSYPGALTQVVLKLVQNAVTHGLANKTGGRIEIVVAKEKSLVSLEVIDNGAGFSAAVGQHVFEPFFTTQRNRGGTGLGLSVSYNLVHQVLKGEISFESVEGAGSTFRLEIPAVVAGETPPAPGPGVES